MHLTPKSLHAASELSRAMNDLPRHQRAVFWRIPSRTVIALHELYLADTYGELRNLRSIIIWMNAKTFLRAYAGQHDKIATIIRKKHSAETAHDIIRGMERVGFNPRLAVGKTASRYGTVLEVIGRTNPSGRYGTLTLTRLESVNALRMAYNETEIRDRIIEVINENSDSYGEVNIDAAMFVETVRTTKVLADGLL